MQSLRGIFPRAKNPPKRDFIRENVISLQQLQLKKQQLSHMTEANAAKPKKLLRKSRSTSNTRFASKSDVSIADDKGHKHDADNSRKLRPLSVQSRDAFSQTETVDDELFLKDVIIRLPSAGLWKSENNVAELYKPDKYDADDIDAIAKVPEDRTETPRLLTSGSVAFVADATETDVNLHGAADDIKSSQQSARGEHRGTVPYARDDGYSAIPPTYRYGELPNYLRQMKIKSAERDRMTALIDPDCPPNHTVLSEAERLESLNIAQTRLKELIDELNRLPMTSTTLRVRDRRITIENELRQLDQTIDVFSRTKVYVKNDKFLSN